MNSINIFSEFLRFYNIYPNSGNHYYRGQADYSWDITPSLARNQQIKKIEDILLLENKLIEKFEKRIIDNKLDSLIPTNFDNYGPRWILLMAAQHYGLPTRFLDFSNDIYTALEFAVADIKYLNKDGALIIFKNPGLYQKDDNSIELSSPFSQTHDSFFFQDPKFGVSNNNNLNLSEERKIIQGSKFLYRASFNLCECISTDKSYTASINKICIPHEFKLEIIKFLINIDRMAYDLLAGKNDIDRYAAILKNEFSQLNESKIVDYLESQ